MVLDMALALTGAFFVNSLYPTSEKGNRYLR
jgi:hypothetical protein